MKIVPSSVELLDYMGSDDAVCDAARVSFGKEAKNYSAEQNAKLINYLAKHNHWSPFAHCFLKFRIKAPIFVSRQMVKHQVGLSWNEVSRRYVDDEPEFYFPEVWRKRAENVKQGSSDEGLEPFEAMEDWDHGGVHYPYELVKQCYRTYTEMLFAGTAPEQARMVLPLNTMTEWVWSGSLMAFARVVNQRKDTHAQKETQEIAHKIQELVPESFNYSWKALVDTAN